MFATFSLCCRLFTRQTGVGGRGDSGPSFDFVLVCAGGDALLAGRFVACGVIRTGRPNSGGVF